MQEGLILSILCEFSFRNLLYVQSSFNIEDILTYLTQFNTFIADRLYPRRVVLNTQKLSAVAVLSLALFHVLYSDTYEVVVFYDLSVKNFFSETTVFCLPFILFCFDSLLCIFSLANDPQI